MKKLSTEKKIKIEKEYRPLKLVWDKDYQAFQESEIRKIKRNFSKVIYHFEDYCDFLENFIYNLPKRKNQQPIDTPFTLYPEKRTKTILGEYSCSEE